MTTAYPDVASSEPDIVEVLSLFRGYVCVGTVPVKYRHCVSVSVDTVPVPVKYGKVITGIVGPTRQLRDVSDT